MGVGGWRVVGRAAGVGFVGTVVLAAGGLLITGLDGFTLIHVAYVVGTVGVPLAGGIVLVGTRGGARPRVVTAVCVLALAAVPVGVYATYVEPFWLRVDRVELAVPAMRAVGEAGTADGVVDVDGVAGADGADGVDGVAGADGVDGVAGVDGVDGAGGADGGVSVDDVDGVAGADGVDGVAGAGGADGGVSVDGAGGADGGVSVDDVDGLAGAGGMDGVDRRIRIGVLADLQTTGVGDYERDAVERLLEFGPDVVVLPGDLYQFDAAVFDERAPGFARLIERIVGEVPHVYLVSGNTDTVAGLRRIVGGSGARVLDNEIDTFEVRGVPVRVGGTTLFGDDAAARRMAAQLVGGDGVDADGADGLVGDGLAGSDGLAGDRLAADGLAGDGRTGPDGDGRGVVRILIGHKPDAIELVRATPVDLAIAGHTHGGQVSLPLFGPPLTLSSVPRHVAAGGLHELYGTPIYVSTGVGRERGNAPQLRLGVRPSIGIIDLVPSAGGGSGAG